jgi:hypothetical protein
MGGRPTEPIPPAGGWGQPPQGPPGGWGTPPPPRPPHQPSQVVVVAAAGGAGAEQPRTVTSIVTSIVPATTTTTTTEPETTTTVRATTTTRRPRLATTTTRRRVTTTTRAPTRNCDLSYPDFCIPPPPPDLDCADVNGRNFTVLPPDPHGLTVRAMGWAARARATFVVEAVRGVPRSPGPTDERRTVRPPRTAAPCSSSQPLLVELGPRRLALRLLTLLCDARTC